MYYVFHSTMLSVVSYRIELLINTDFAVVSTGNVNEYIQQFDLKQVGVSRKFALRV